MSENNRENLVAEFSVIEREYVDAPEEFIQAAGYALISMTMGYYYRAPMLPSKGRPNLWIILSSIPGRTRRSTLQSDVMYVYKKVMRDVLKADKADDHSQTKVQSEDEDAEQSIDDAVDDLILEEGSPEGITDHLEDTNSKRFHLDSSEFGIVLQKMQGDGYESGSGVLYSKLYYGEGGVVHLSKRNGNKGTRRLRANLYVTAFLGMQEPWKYLTLDSIDQGLPRRLLINYIPKNPRYEAPINDKRMRKYFDLDRFAEKLSQYTLMARKMALENMTSQFGEPFVQVNFNPRVTKALNKFDEELARRLDAQQSVINLITQSMQEVQNKLAMCNQIGRARLNIQEKTADDIRKVAGVNSVTVTEEAHAEAKAFLDKVLENYSLFVDHIGEKTEKSGNVKKPQDDLYYYIASGGANGRKQTEITKKFRWGKKVLEDRFSELMTMQVIEFKGIETGGRSATVWFVTGEPYE
jgi:hypothetical protein